MLIVSEDEVAVRTCERLLLGHDRNGRPRTDAGAVRQAPLSSECKAFAMSVDLALVHDYLTQRGGAERVVLTLAKGLGIPKIHTSFYDPARTYEEFAQLEVVASKLNKIAVFRRFHRAALPFYPAIFSRMRIEAAVTICSTSGWSHGVQTTGRKVAYCYAPARWLYQTSRYLGSRSLLRRASLEVLRPYLAAFDRRAAASVDRYVTISNVSARAIREAYGIEAEVLHPPPGIEPEGEASPPDAVAPGFVLCVSRLLPYKNVTVVAEALAAQPDCRLVIVGSGPLEAELRKFAERASNIALIPHVSDEQLRWLYKNCRFVVSASYEDFGLVPLEAACFGKPAVVLRWGGFLDSVVEGETGLFFDSPEVTAVAKAVREALERSWNEKTIRSHADKFSRKRFIARFEEIVREEAALL